MIGGADAREFWYVDGRARQFLARREFELQQLRQLAPVDHGLELPPPMGPQASRAQRPSLVRSWTAQWTIRDLLLALGVFSLIVALVSFAVVSWDDLSTTGRVVVVLATTTIVGGATVALDRRRLHATAEALAVVWAALLVADVAAARFLVIPDSAPLAFWAGGMGAVTLLLLGLSRISATRAAPPLALIAGALPLPLLAIDRSSQILAAVAGIAGFGAAQLANDALARRSGRFGTVVNAAVQHLSWSFAAVSALIGLSWNGHGGVVFSLAAIATGLTLAYRAGRSAPRLLADLWIGKAAGLVVATTIVLTERQTNGPWVLLAAALSAATILAAADRSTHPGRYGGIASSGLVLVPIAFLLLMLAGASVGVIGQPITDPWTGTATARLELKDFQGPSDRFVALALLLTLAVTVADRLRNQPRWWASAAGAVGLLSLATIVAVLGAPAWVAVAMLIGTALTTLVLTGNSEGWAADIAAGATAALGIASALATAEVTIAALALTSAAFWLLSFRSQTDSVRAVWLAAAAMVASGGLALAITTNAGWSDGSVGLAVLVTVALLTLFPILGTDATLFGLYRTAPGVSLAIEGSGVLIAGPTTVTIAVLGGAGRLTAALLILAGTCVLHAIRPGRTWLAVVAAALTAAATAVQLHAADVTMVEAYALPASLAAGAYGYYAYRGDRNATSWLTWGPATAVALGPSLVVAVGRDAGMRPLILPLVGLAVIGFGLWNRLQAPVLLGTAVVITVGADLLITLASELPRWVPFGGVGLLLLLLGANFEQNRARAQHVMLQIHDLT